MYRRRRPREATASFGSSSCRNQRGLLPIAVRWATGRRWSTNSSISRLGRPGMPWAGRARAERAGATASASIGTGFPRSRAERRAPPSAGCEPAPLRAHSRASLPRTGRSCGGSPRRAGACGINGRKVTQAGDVLRPSGQSGPPSCSYVSGTASLLFAGTCGYGDRSSRGGEEGVHSLVSGECTPGVAQRAGSDHSVAKRPEEDSAACADGVSDGVSTGVPRRRVREPRSRRHRRYPTP